MRPRTILAAALAGGLGAGAAQAASIEVKDAVVRVTVVPENRTDIRVEIISANPRLPLTVRSTAGRTTLDGGLDRKIRSCGGSGEHASVDVRGRGSFSYQCRGW